MSNGTQDRTAPTTVAGRPAAGSVAGTGAIDSTGIALALCGALLFSLKPIFIKLNYEYDVGASTQLALRMLFSVPFYSAIALHALRNRRAKALPTDLSRRSLVSTVLIGFLGYYLTALLDMEGLAHITAQFERLILFTFPTFVAILGYWFFGERLGPRHLVSIGLTYLGLATIFARDLHSLGDSVVIGTGLVLTSSVTYAIYLLLAKGRIRAMGSQLFTSISMLAGTVGTLGHFLVLHPVSDLIVPMPVVWLCLAMSILATFIPSLLIAEAINRIGPGPASVTTGAGPMFTSLMAIWILGEEFSVWHALGTALVIGGILVLSRERS